MPTELSDYIKNNLSQGLPEATIKENLLKNGWNKEQVDKAFSGLSSAINKTPPKKRSYRILFFVSFVLCLSLFFSTHSIILPFLSLLFGTDLSNTTADFFLSYIQLLSPPIAFLFLVVYFLYPLFTRKDKDKQLEVAGVDQKEIDKSKSYKKRNILIFIFFLIFSFFTTPLYFAPPDGLFIKLGIFGNEQSLQNSGLAGAFIIGMVGFIAIPIIAGILSTLTIVGLNMLRRVEFGGKMVAYIFLGIAAVGVLFPIYNIVSLRLTYNKKVSSIPSKVDFQIYKPNSSNPFKNLNESYQLSSESGEKRCKAVHYTYYGSTTGALLTEMQADATGCPDVFYLNVNDYQKYAKIANTNVVNNNYKVTTQRVGNDTILILRDNNSGYLNRIYGIKSSTLIMVDAECTNLDDPKKCEQKYLDFYTSLEPLK